MICAHKESPVRVQPIMHEVVLIHSVNPPGVGYLKPPLA